MCPTGPWIQLSKYVSERREVLPLLTDAQCRSEAMLNAAQWNKKQDIRGRDAAWPSPSNRVKSGSRARHMYQSSSSQSRDKLQTDWTALSPTCAALSPEVANRWALMIKKKANTDSKHIYRFQIDGKGIVWRLRPMKLLSSWRGLKSFSNMLFLNYNKIMAWTSDNPNAIKRWKQSVYALHDSLIAPVFILKSHSSVLPTSNTRHLHSFWKFLWIPKLIRHWRRCWWQFYQNWAGFSHLKIKNSRQHVFTLLLHKNLLPQFLTLRWLTDDARYKSGPLDLMPNHFQPLRKHFLRALSPDGYINPSIQSDSENIPSDFPFLKWRSGAVSCVCACTVVTQCSSLQDSAQHWSAKRLVRHAGDKLTQTVFSPKTRYHKMHAFD